MQNANIDFNRTFWKIYIHKAISAMKIFVNK